MIKAILFRPLVIRLLHWEYWPFHVVYGPVYIYWLWLSLRARSFFFFNTSNPTISNGGFLMESKSQIHILIPEQYCPQTIFFQAGYSFEKILKEIKRKQFQFPLVAKPDIGMQGKSVKKLNYENELKEYAASSKVNFLVQEYVSFENEIGIFYYRFPNEEKGKISGIVKKEFLAVEGDGESTITELLRKDKRYILQIPALKKLYGSELEAILQKKEKRVLFRTAIMHAAPSLLMQVI